MYHQHWSFYRAKNQQEVAKSSSWTRSVAQQDGCVRHEKWKTGSARCGAGLGKADACSRDMLSDLMNASQLTDEPLSQDFVVYFEDAFFHWLPRSRSGSKLARWRSTMEMDLNHPSSDTTVWALLPDLDYASSAFGYSRTIFSHGGHHCWSCIAIEARHSYVSTVQVYIASSWSLLTSSRALGHAERLKAAICAAGKTHEISGYDLLTLENELDDTELEVTTCLKKLACISCRQFCDHTLHRLPLELRGMIYENLTGENGLDVQAAK